MILPPRKDPSCVLWLDFTSITNNTVYDQSSYGNHGTVYGAVPVGKFGRHGLHFDGVNDYVEIQNSENINLQDEMTVMIYTRNYIYTGAKLIFDKGLTWRIGFKSFLSKAIGFLSTDINGNLNEADYYGFSGNVFNGMLVGVYDLNNSIQKLYINDELKASVTIVNKIESSTNKIMIGLYYYSSNYYYAQADVYFAALYNRALSDAEISELYYYIAKGIKSKIPSRFVQRGVRV